MKNSISQTIIRRLINIFSKEVIVVAAYFFGSRASGKQRPASDLDIGIICLAKNRINQLELAVKIQKVIPDTETDVIIVDLSDNPLLLIQIINGKMIFQKNLTLRTQLETRILHLYEDSKHLREIENHYLKKSFTEGVYAH